MRYGGPYPRPAMRASREPRHDLLSNCRERMHLRCYDGLMPPRSGSPSSTRPTPKIDRKKDRADKRLVALPAETMVLPAGTLCRRFYTVDKMPAWPRHFWHARPTLHHPSISNRDAVRGKKIGRPRETNQSILPRAKCECAVRTDSAECEHKRGRARALFYC